MRRLVGRIPIKTMVSLGLLAYIVYHVGRTDLIESIASVSPFWFLLACAAFAAGQMLNSVRWKMLVVSVERVNPRIVDLFLLNLVGMFYNFFAPSTIGGDVLQAETAKRHIGGRQHAYVSIIVNRVIALFAVVVIAAVFILVAAPVFDLGRIYAYILLGLSALVAASILGLPYFRRWIADGGDDRRGPRAWARATRRCVERYLENRDVLARVFLLAIVSNLIGQVLVVWSIAESVGVVIPALYHFLFVPIIVLVTLVPITLNGIGLREAAFIYFYAGAGVAAPDAVAISVVFTGLLVAFGLAGGVATLSPRYRLSLK